MTDPTPPQGPRIGADEWVARQGERRRQPVLERVVDHVTERVSPPMRFAVLVGGAAIFGIATSNEYYQRVGFNTLYYATLALGLNVIVGWAGCSTSGTWPTSESAHTSTPSSTRRSSDCTGRPRSRWRSPAVGCAIVGILVSLPSRRLFGDYLAIITLFFGQIFYNLVGNLSITNGQNGLTNLDPLGFFGLHITNVRRYYYVALVVFTVVVIVLWLINHSRTGRAWRRCARTRWLHSSSACR